MAMTLLTGSILLLGSCRSTIPKEEGYIEIPQLDITAEKPVLEEIPSLDVSDYTDEQIEALSAVLAAYNSNLGKLVIYTEELERINALKFQYMSNVITILNEQ